MSKIKIGLLVEDLDVYPRESIDTTHVGHIADAVESGAVLPPIVADSKSKRIVDGFHRRRAYMRLYGDDYETNVTLVTYKSEADLFADAVARNACHGNNITPHDRTRCLLIAGRLGIADCDIARALNITVDRVNEIRATRLGKRRASAVSVDGDDVPLKYPARHMAGQTLTAAQVKVMPDLGGNQQAFYANQLIKLIETRLLDMTNERLIERLKVLREMLDGIL